MFLSSFILIMRYLSAIIIACTLLLTCLFQSNGQNIALNKSYTLSTPPNYALSAPATDKTSLTDGISYDNEQGILWTKSSTVGWQRSNRITVTIDLEKTQVISAVTFNTARRMQAGVYYPQN